jgi:hypothetical protein
LDKCDNRLATGDYDRDALSYRMALAVMGQYGTGVTDTAAQYCSP